MTEHVHSFRLDIFASGRGGPERCECGEIRPPGTLGTIGPDGIFRELKKGDTNVQTPPALSPPEPTSSLVSEETLVKIAKASKPGTSPRRWLANRKKAKRKAAKESRRKNRRGK